MRADEQHMTQSCGPGLAEPGAGPVQKLVFSGWVGVFPGSHLSLPHPPPCPWPRPDLGGWGVWVKGCQAEDDSLGGRMCPLPVACIRV